MKESESNYKYKGYNANNNKNVYNYLKRHYKIVSLRIDKQFYDEELKPFCDKKNISVGAYIKQLITKEFNK